MPELLSNDVLTLIADRFRVLAEPARLRILNSLMAGECTVSELVERTELQQANLSKHLGLLRSAGFVARRREGLYAWYSIEDPSVAELCQIMCGRLERQAERRVEVLAGETPSEGAWVA
jgi:ArsR family transcriptional regulator